MKKLILLIMMVATIATITSGCALSTIGPGQLHDPQQKATMALAKVLKKLPNPKELNAPENAKYKDEIVEAMTLSCDAKYGAFKDALGHPVQQQYNACMGEISRLFESEDKKKEAIKDVFAGAKTNKDDIAKANELFALLAESTDGSHYIKFGSWLTGNDSFDFHATGGLNEVFMWGRRDGIVADVHATINIIGNNGAITKFNSGPEFISLKNYALYTLISTFRGNDIDRTSISYQAFMGLLVVAVATNKDLTDKNMDAVINAELSYILGPGWQEGMDDQFSQARIIIGNDIVNLSDTVVDFKTNLARNQTILNIIKRAL